MAHHRTAGVSGLFILLLALLIPSVPASELELPKADRVLVLKSEKRLYLIRNNVRFREYRIALGENPKGHKQKQGDERTPEGHYILDYKNPYSHYYRSIHVSYPNEQDRKAARAKGWNPGGDIMIHGQPNGYGWAGFALQWFNWTNGCIAVRNDQMAEIWKTVDPGTPIEIRP